MFNDKMQSLFFGGIAYLIWMLLSCQHIRCVLSEKVLHYALAKKSVVIPFSFYRSHFCVK
jgi:hypothetical protein